MSVVLLFLIGFVSEFPPRVVVRGESLGPLYRFWFRARPYPPSRSDPTRSLSPNTVSTLRESRGRPGVVYVPSPSLPNDVQVLSALPFSLPSPLASLLPAACVLARRRQPRCPVVATNNWSVAPQARHLQVFGGGVGTSRDDGVCRGGSTPPVP